MNTYGVTTDEILKVTEGVVERIIRAKEDDGKIDAKETVLLVKELCLDLAGVVDDPGVADRLHTVAKILGWGAAFTPGTTLDD